MTAPIPPIASDVTAAQAAEQTLDTDATALLSTYNALLTSYNTLLAANTALVAAVQAAGYTVAGSTVSPALVAPATAQQLASEQTALAAAQAAQTAAQANVTALQTVLQNAGYMVTVSATGVTVSPQIIQTTAATVTSQTVAPNYTPADEVVEFMGMATQLDYAGKLADNGATVAMIKNFFAQTKFRYMRTGGTDTVFLNNMLDFFNSLGVRTTSVCDPRCGLTAPLTQLASIYTAQYAPALVMFEGIDEPDDYPTCSYGGATGLQAALLYQRDLEAAIIAAPALQKIILLQPSWANPGPTLLAKIKAAMAANGQTAIQGLGNLHPYPGGGLPTVNLQNTMNFVAALNGLSANSLLYVTTEDGYNGNLVSGSAGQPGIDQLAAAKYLPRLIFEQFLMPNIERCHLYDAYPPDAGTWSMAMDATGNLTSVGNTLKNIIALLSDIGGVVRGNGMSYTIAGQPATGKSVLLKKSDNSFWLVTWNNVSVYTPGSSSAGDVTNATIKATVTFPTAPTSCRQYYPRLGAGGASMGTPSTTMTVPFADEIVFSQFTW